MLYRLLAGFSMLVVLNAAAADAQTLACGTPGAEDTQRIADIKMMLASPDSQYVQLRNAIRVTNVDTSTVTVMTDSAVCTSVTRSIEAAFQSSPPTTTAVMVLKAGPQYLAFVPPGEGALFVVELDYTFRTFVH